MAALARWQRSAILDSCLAGDHEFTLVVPLCEESQIRCVALADCGDAGSSSHAMMEPAWIDLRRTMLKHTHILVVSPDFPKPDIAAGDLRLFMLLELLAKRYSVDFWSPHPSGAEKSTEQEYRRNLGKIGVNVLPHWGGDLSRVANYEAYDVMICEFWSCAEWAAPELRRVQPWVYTVVDSVDVHFLREESGLRLGLGDPVQVAENKAREIAVYRECDAVIVVTEEDRKAIDAVGGVRKQVVVPIIILPRTRPDLKRGANLLFVGGFVHTPNVDGITWFVRDILPLVKAEIPSTRLTVVGSNAPPEVRALGEMEGVEIVGYVSTTGPYLDRAVVSVAPLRFGAGMKGKVCEAMAFGLAVVTTGVGAQGLGAVSGKHLFIAEREKDFAEAVIDLLRDHERAKEIGRCGQELISRLCGPQTVAESVTRFVEEIPNRRSPAAWVQWRMRTALDQARKAWRSMKPKERVLG